MFESYTTHDLEEVTEQDSHMYSHSIHVESLYRVFESAEYARELSNVQTDTPAWNAGGCALNVCLE